MFSRLSSRPKVFMAMVVTIIGLLVAEPLPSGTNPDYQAAREQLKRSNNDHGHSEP
jgi:hypothetical protein